MNNISPRRIEGAQTGRRYRSRPLRWLTLTGVVLAAAALPPGFAAPAQAQNTFSVSNIRASDIRISDSAGTLDIPQPFTTGQKAEGYYLGSIELRFSVLPADSNKFTVSLNAANDDGSPGDELCYLTNPDTIAINVLVEFNASSNCPKLNSQTTYFVRVETTNTSVTLWGTDDGSETTDPPEADTGWSIADQYYADPQFDTDPALQVRINVAIASATFATVSTASANTEILSKHALTVADAANRAIRERMGAAFGNRPASFNLAGSPTLGQALRSNARAIEDGALTLGDVLAGSSFLLPLAAADDGMAGGAGGPVVWGRGNRQTLESTDSDFAWDGTVLTGQLGIDTRLRDDLLAGLALSRSVGEFDYTAGAGLAPVRGGYESRMTSVHPYLGWALPQGLDLWATLGYGRGEIEIDDPQVRGLYPDKPVRRSDTTLKTAAMGALGPLMSDGSLIEGGTTTLMLKGEASVARVEVAGNGDLIEKETVHANRLRLALEGSHEQALASGGSLTPSLELGLRRDGSDGETGGGIEIGGGLRYRDPATGLTVEGSGRVLAGQGDYREWGFGGSVRFDPGAGGRGLSFSLLPAWGETASGVDRLWDQDVAELASDDTAANDNVPPMRLDSELGYGFGALGGRRLLTPYGGFALAGEGSRRYRIGGRFEIGSSLNLSLEGERREPANAAAAEHGVMLRMQASW